MMMATATTSTVVMVMSESLMYLGSEEISPWGGTEPPGEEGDLNRAPNIAGSTRKPC